jgi:hypothetical protein
MTHPPAHPRYPRLFAALVGGLTLLVAACGDAKDKDKAARARGGRQLDFEAATVDKKADKKVDKSVDKLSDKMAEKDGRMDDPRRLDRPAAPAGVVNAPPTDAAPVRDTIGGTGKYLSEKDGRPAKGGFRDRDGAIPGLDRPKIAVGPGSTLPKPAAPKVWKRDAARPTVARVYVGDSNSLELVSMHVSVHVEGPRARTVVDHVFRNPHDKQLEGTFEYPVPAGASPSYYAMFLGATRQAQPQMFKPNSNGTPLPLPETLTPAQLARAVDASDWGKLQEARLIAPDKALEAYEEVVRGKVDPALLEYASGNTFRGRVFPIAARGYNRVLIAYEETIPVSAGRLVYRFALPTSKVHEVRFSLEASTKEVDSPTFEPAEARKETNDDRVRFTHTWADDAPKGEVTFSATPKTPTIQVTTGRHGDKGPNFVYARLRPALPAVPKEEPFAKHAVFLLDTSLSEHSDRFGVSMKLLKTILETDTGIEKFNIVAFNAGAAWVAPKGWMSNTKEGRDKALSLLDGVVLEGATDLSAALDKLVNPGFDLDAKTPLACFVLSDGHLTWGRTEVPPLVARFRRECTNPLRFFCYRTGLGQENAELFDALTRDGGGVFQCYGEAEVPAAARAHRRQCLVVDRVAFADDAGAKEVIVGGRRSAVYPDGELVVVGQLPKAGKTSIRVTGSFQGQKFDQTYPIDVRADGELAARAWGEVAVASLLSLNDPWMQDLVTAYCQEFNVASRAASYLVLENDAEYKRLKVDDEKGKTLSNDLGKYLDDAWVTLAKDTSSKQAVGKLLFQIDGRTKVLSGAGGDQVKRLLGLLSEADCVLPEAIVVPGAILLAKDANKTYLQDRDKDRRAVGPYLTESQRRASADDIDGAVRVLSSVIEEHPSRGDALRLVGYRLMDLRKPALAAKLFGQVLRGRPFEPHSFRDLARSLEEAGQFPLSALCYEAVLAGTWHNRFGDALKAVTREDYARVLAAGLSAGQLPQEQAAFFRDRLNKLGSTQPADLRVTITWNTDATDVDLHVLEPDRTRVMYSTPKSRSGGELSQDQTQGYGPERYQIRKAPKGEFTILVHNFRRNPNLLGGETHVNVTITRFAGTDQEKVMRRTVILSRDGEMVEVAKMRY